jgi:REP element-mobilizing transposase RayT
MSQDRNHLDHATWECKYHVVFTPKYRKKLLLNVERKLRNFLGHKFWARGYFVSTVGRDEEMIRSYIKNQEIADKQLDQLQLKLASS